MPAFLNQVSCVELLHRHRQLMLGLLLCKRKKDAVVELTLPKGANVFAAQYELYLPSKDDLRQRLMQWTAEAEGLIGGVVGVGTQSLGAALAIAVRVDDDAHR